MPGRIILLFWVFIEVQSSPAPTYTLCKEDDSVCLTKLANTIFKRTVSGVPELNIDNLDPMHQDEIDGDLHLLQYKLHNTTIIGSKNCDVDSMKLDLKKSKLQLNLTCPLLSMYGLYEITGQILSVPIEGNGDYTIECKEGYFIEVDTDTKISRRKDGTNKKFIALKRYKINSELNGGMVINLSNLFNGKRKELAEIVLEFMNKNWKPVVKELQGPVFNVNMKKLIKNFNKYLKTIPLEQMLLNYH